MLQIKISNTARKFLDSIPGEDCVKIVQLFLLSGKSPAKDGQLKNYPFRYRDAGKYRVVFDIVDGVNRILFVENIQINDHSGRMA